ncbi:uncharacterized protein OCT59_009994 [Rhizophagus irregularis]|uniref:uncharacterized protein n=1 Tax=Rhizophagus irregularis TaxID=588596 RepID=UPI00331B82A4|nr:hypothetical protein OCT59_009994 [Rhizophagus irregularis]
MWTPGQYCKRGSCSSSKDIAIEMVCNYVQIQDNIVIEVYKWIVVAVDIADDVVVDVVGEVDVDVAVAVFKNNLHD